MFVPDSGSRRTAAAALFLLALAGAGPLAAQGRSPTAVTPDKPAAPATVYNVEAAIDDMTRPNTDGMFPSHGPVTSPERASDPNQWGADRAGDPSTRSYAYVDMKIRAFDRGPSGRGFTPYATRGALGDLGLPRDAVVRRFPWVVVGDAWQKRNTSPNTRVQVRNIRHWVLGFDRRWIDGGSNTMTVPPRDYGSWHSIWLGPGMASGDGKGHSAPIGTGRGLSDGRVEPDGGSSLGSIGLGHRPTGVNPRLEYYNSYVWHFYPLPGFDRPLLEWESAIAGSLICLEARLVPHDASQPDDGDRSAMLLNVGADFYSVRGETRYLGATMHSRWKRVTRDWQLFCTTDLTATALRDNSPPGFGAGAAGSK